MNTFMEFWNAHQGEIILLGKNLLVTLLVLLLGLIVCRIVKKAITRAAEKIERIDPSVGKIFYSVARVFIWLFALLIILDRFGVNTASIITVLGTAGLAIGLAMKDSLSNVAAGLMLLILRPFRSGDQVDCSTVSGTIKEIGLFTTELCTEDGVFVIVPNKLIIAAPIKNRSRNGECSCSVKTEDK